MDDLKPMWSCRNIECASEISYHEDMLAEHPEGGAICESCWDHEWIVEDPSWGDLPSWISPTTEELTALRDAVKGLLANDGVDGAYDVGKLIKYRAKAKALTCEDKDNGRK